MADRIDQLPKTDSAPSPLDSEIMNDLFNKQKPESSGVNWKHVMILSALFVVLNLPLVNNALKDALPNADTSIFMAKTAIFIIAMVILGFVN
jgi:hypothetical protein